MMPPIQQNQSQAQSSQAQSQNQSSQSQGLGRRAFLHGTTLVLTTAATSRVVGKEPAEPLQIGLVTDLHYADKPTRGTRHYRDTIDKLAVAADSFETSKPEFIVELGDLIDAADSVETELRYLKRINREFAPICQNRHYVLGNHCVDTLHKREFLDQVEQKKSYYSFDSAGHHFIVLDSCFRSDGVPYGRKNFEWTDPNIPAEELEWLRADLANNHKPTIVFAHQRLDVAHQHGVKNGESVRAIFESSGKVAAVFQGHSHKNDHQEIRGIHYCTLVAMVEGSGLENNGFSILNVDADGTIQVTGFVKQAAYNWPS